MFCLLVFLRLLISVFVIWLKTVNLGLVFYLSGRESCQFISKLVVILDWDGEEFTVKKIEGDKLLKKWTENQMLF